jgi:hypothetical protein
MKKVFSNAKYGRILLFMGVLLLALAPSPALAHDNLGGDELAVANWMLVFAMITVVIGALWAIWGLMNGQFDGIESSKYTMLETADDFEGIMAEFDAEEKAARDAEQQIATNSSTTSTTTDTLPAVPKPGGKTVSI